MLLFLFVLRRSYNVSWDVASYLHQFAGWSYYVVPLPKGKTMIEGDSLSPASVLMEFTDSVHYYFYCFMFNIVLYRVFRELFLEQLIYLLSTVKPIP